MDNSISKDVFVYNDGKFIADQRYISTEDKFVLNYENERREFSCTLTDLEDLAYGYLYTNGLIESKDNIKTIRIEKDHGQLDMGEGQRSYKKSVNTRISIHEIIESIKDFNKASEKNSKTKAAHNCSLYIRGKLVLFRDDVARHNAFDKLIGACVKNDLDLYNTLVITTGRLSYSMVKKLASIGALAGITLAKPTESAIGLAKDNNMILIGEAREDGRFTVFTGKDQIIL